MNFAVLTTTFVAVLVAEVLGDKLLYNTGALAARYSSVRVAIGAALGSSSKMAVAACAANYIRELSREVFATLTTLSFALLAIAMYRRLPSAPTSSRGAGGLAVAFGTTLLSEWADAGQLTAAAFVIRTGQPFAVGVGAMLAVSTKAVVAAVLGARLRTVIERTFSDRHRRLGGLAFALIVYVWSIIELCVG